MKPPILPIADTSRSLVVLIKCPAAAHLHHMQAPGWWFGIEPNPADVLIQPILAYGDGTPDYTIFTGFYDWHDGNWVQSTTQTVTPGQQVLGSVTWREASGTYQQCIQLVARNAKPICTVVSKANEHGETFTDVYFVVEHQPNSCAEYPSNGNVVFDNIQIAWESGAVLTPQSWTVAQYQPACNSNGTVVSASSLKFTWDTS